MGFLKKLTKPLSKFLDKIIPNEIKPALPYLSAFAPFMMGPGIMGSSMLQRGLMSGALNIGSQLAQEGSEGDVDWLSAALAGGIGSLTAPGKPGQPFGTPAGTRYTPGTPSASDFLAGKAKAMDTGFLKSGTEALSTGAGWLDTQGDILRPGGAPLTMKNALTAASVPVTQGTADLARITAEQELKRLEDEEDDDPFAATNEGRRIAIRRAMEMAGHLEEDILSALASLGLRSGGIVGLRDGGRIGYIHGGVTHPDGRRGFFKGAEKDARAGRASMSPGTHHGGGMRSGFGGTGNTGTGTTTTTPITKTIKTKTAITPTTNWADKFKGWFGTTDPDEVDLGGGLAEIAKNQIIANRTATTNAIADLVASGDLDLAQGGRVGLLRGGDPDDYSQQQDVGTFELQQEEGVPIGPMVQEDKQKQLLKAFAKYQAGGGTLSLKQFAAMWIRENAAGGGRIGFDKGGFNYSDFGKDRYRSEMFEDYSGILGPAENLFSDVEKELETGKFPEPEKLKGWTKEYEDLENKFEKTEDRYEDKEEKFDAKELKDKGLLDYYKKKYEDTEKRYEDIEERGDRLLLDNLDASEITRTPDFQMWLKLYEAKDPKAKKHPYHEVFEEILFTKLGSRDTSYMQETDFDYFKKSGGRIGAAQGGVASVLPRGTEADYRGGGVIPVGSKERADDVPARLSKNEFVMTADAVKAAGGGSVNRGAKKMYNLMHNLEARV